jgi:hypothetical protein
VNVAQKLQNNGLFWLQIYRFHANSKCEAILSREAILDKAMPNRAPQFFGTYGSR